MTTEFAAWLQREMDRREWGVTRLARELGINHGTISLWLSGQRHPSPRSLDKIADVFVYDLDELLAIAGHRTRTDVSRLAEIHAVLDRYLVHLSDNQVEGVKRILETLVGRLDAPTSPPDQPESSPPSLADRTGNSHEGR